MKLKQRSMALASLLALTVSGLCHATDHDAIRFKMVPSAPEKCLPDARGYVYVKSEGDVEKMWVAVAGLPANTEFDLFVIQTPGFPFGLSWYQGDITTNKYGWGGGRFIGRFNEETFIVAPGVTDAPFVHNKQIPDAESNPQTGPVHTYHLGLWFNSPEDAANAGCATAVTPFNGEHNAGVQVLNTGNFDDREGPLKQLKP